MTDQDAPSPSEQRLRTLFLGTILVFVVALSYLPVGKAGFLWDDDDEYHLNDDRPWYVALFRIWCTSSMWDYYPVTWTTCWVESHLFGHGSLGYHLVNLAFHVVGVVLLWRALQGLQVRHAYFVAMIFGVHPLTTASVAWVAEIKNTLSLIFYALTVIFYVRWLREVPANTPTPTAPTGETGAVARSPEFWYRLALGSFVLALLSKTSGVLLPLFLLACIPWVRGGWSRDLVRRTLPFLGLTFVMALVTVWFQKTQSLQGQIPNNDNLVTRLASAGGAFWFYVGKSLWPPPVMMVYPDVTLDPRHLVSWGPDAAFLLCAAAAWWGRGRAWGRSLALALVYVVAMLLPVLGFFDMSYMRFSRVSDQFVYLALCGMIALYVAAADGVLRPLGRLRAPLLAVAAVAVVASLCGMTWRQASLYTDGEAYWRENVRRNPNAWLAWANLARALAGRGAFSEAVPCYERSLRAYHMDEEIWHDCGYANVKCGRLQVALYDYKQAARVQPLYASAHNNCGIVLEKLRRDDEAIAEFRLAMQADPQMVEPIDNLATLLTKKGRNEEAAQLYRHALDVNPHSAEVWNNYGSLLIDERKDAQAVDCFLRAVDLNTELPEVYLNLGNVLGRLGRTAEAIRAFENLGRLRPGDPSPANTIGMLYGEQQRLDKALESFNRAISIDPSYAPALNNMALIYALSPQGHWRDPSRALPLAARACALTHWKSASVIHTLALAQASAGQYRQAVQTEARARAVLDAREADLGKSIRACEERFRAGIPCEPNGTPLHPPVVAQGTPGPARNP